MQVSGDTAKKQAHIRRLAEENPAYRFLAGCPVELLRYGRNEDICVSGEPMSHLLLLVEGRAKIFISMENGKALLLEFVEGFQVIGDLELVSGKRDASASVRTITQTYCLGLPMALRENLMSDPCFLRLVSTELAVKLDSCSKSYAVNMLYPLESRLASYLLHTEENGLFYENMGSLSEYLGASYRHLLRVTGGFLRQGLIRREAKGYRITDRPALERLGGNVYQYGVRGY